MSTTFDIMGIAGALLVSAGAYQVYPPAGYIVLGCFLLLAATAGGRAMSRRASGWRAG